MTDPYESMVDLYKYTVWDINPQPWTAAGIPKLGRPVKDGKLVAYQEALRDELIAQNPEYFTFPEDALLTVEFLFWRSSRSAKQVDTTNVQKATEDALQGVLYINDKRNRRVTSEIVEQNPDERPCIVIYIQPYTSQWVKPPEPAAVGRWEDTDWEAPDKEMF